MVGKRPFRVDDIRQAFKLSAIQARVTRHGRQEDQWEHRDWLRRRRQGNRFCCARSANARSGTGTSVGSIRDREFVAGEGARAFLHVAMQYKAEALVNGSERLPIGNAI